MNMLMGVIPQIINCEQAGMLQFSTNQRTVKQGLTREDDEVWDEDIGFPGGSQVECAIVHFSSSF